jgi:hypothetical protein
MKLAQMGIVEVIGNITDEKTFFTDLYEVQASKLTI